MTVHTADRLTWPEVALLAAAGTPLLLALAGMALSWEWLAAAAAVVAALVGFAAIVVGLEHL